MLHVSSLAPLMAALLASACGVVAETPDATALDATALDAPLDGTAPDAAVDAAPALVPDVSGDWLLAADTGDAGGGAIVQLLVSWRLTPVGAGATLAGSYQPLRTFRVPPDSAMRTPVGAPFTGDTTVAEDRSFAQRLTGTLPGLANPINGTSIGFDMQLTGEIRGTDAVCGTLTGTVGPLAVTGTFGAIRAADPLPAPVTACL